jgi:transposase-like protein
MSIEPAKSVSVTPPPCPFCASTHVTTTTKTVSDATYWRCGACGQIWNASRLLAWKVRR